MAILETAGPGWIQDSGRRVRARLLTTELPSTVGHLDWEAQSGLGDGEPVAVFD